MYCLLAVELPTHTNYTPTPISLSSSFSTRAVPGTFTRLKWSLVPPDFKELYKILMKIVQILIKKK